MCSFGHDINGNRFPLKPDLGPFLGAGLHQSIATCFDAYCYCGGGGHTGAGTFHLPREFIVVMGLWKRMNS